MRPNNMPTQKKSVAPFTKTGRFSLLRRFWKGKHSQQVPVKLLRRCEEVTMEQFMACMCENDLSVLVVEGVPTPEELAEAWAALFYEYCDVVGASEAKYHAKITLHIELLRSQVNMGTGWLKMLQYRHSDNIVKALQNIGFEYDFDPADDVQLAGDIARAYAEIRSLSLDLKAKEMEFEHILKNKKTTDDGVDRKYFYAVFDNINDLKKREAINAQSTVMQFAIALSRIAEEMERKSKNAKTNARI